MALWDTLRALDVDVDAFATEQSSVHVSTDFRRVTTTVVLSGGGCDGRGEDVTYNAENHEWFPQLEPPGKTTAT